MLSCVLGSRRRESGVGFGWALARKPGCCPCSQVFADPSARRDEEISWTEQQATPLQWQWFSSSDGFCLTVDKGNIELGIKTLPVSERLPPSKAGKSHQWCLCKVTALERVLSLPTPRLPGATTPASAEVRGGSALSHLVLAGQRVLKILKIDHYDHYITDLERDTWSSGLFSPAWEDASL